MYVCKIIWAEQDNSILQWVKTKTRVREAAIKALPIRVVHQIMAGKQTRNTINKIH